MNKPRSLIASALILLLSVAGSANAAAPEARSERVDFANGATSRVIKGQVKGFAYVDYPLHAGAGHQCDRLRRHSAHEVLFYPHPNRRQQSISRAHYRHE